MTIVLRLLTWQLYVVRNALVDVDVPPAVVTYNGHRYLRDKDSDADLEGPPVFVYVEELNYVL